MAPVRFQDFGHPFARDFDAGKVAMAAQPHRREPQLPKEAFGLVDASQRGVRDAGVMGKTRENKK